MKGQFFIFTAVIIVFSIAALANLAVYTSLPAQEAGTSTIGTAALVDNFKTEAVNTMKMEVNTTTLDDLTDRFEADAASKNIALNITRAASDTGGCTFEISSPVTTSYAFNATASSSFSSETTTTSFKVCY